MNKLAHFNFVTL